MNKLKRTVLLASGIGALALPGLSAAQDELIPASDIIGRGVSNGLNQIGLVQNALLDEDGKAVEYLFFDASETFRPAQSDMSFVEIDNVDFSPGAAGAWQVVVTDTDAQHRPEELQVDRSEADYRLLSNVLEESINFSDDEALKIDDILINPETGALEYFTVELNADSFFDTDMRFIPASDVEIGAAGKVSSAVSLAELERDSRYRPQGDSVIR